jgi:predicted transposase
MYTMKIQLLADEQQHEQLTQVMKRFNEVCNHISKIGFRTRTHRNKIKLSKECYTQVRENYSLPSQMVVRAIGKVVEGYKTGSKIELKFGETTSVVYDKRQLAFKWMNRISISTFDGRIEVPFRVTGYRQGTYDRRVTGQADLILQDNMFYLLLLVDLPEVAHITTMEFAEVAT